MERAAADAMEADYNRAYAEFSMQHVQSAPLVAQLKQVGTGGPCACVRVCVVDRDETRRFGHACPAGAATALDLAHHASRPATACPCNRLPPQTQEEKAALVQKLERLKAMVQQVQRHPALPRCPVAMSRAFAAAHRAPACSLMLGP